MAFPRVYTPERLELMRKELQKRTPRKEIAKSLGVTNNSLGLKLIRLSKLPEWNELIQEYRTAVRQHDEEDSLPKSIRSSAIDIVALLVYEKGEQTTSELSETVRDIFQLGSMKGFHSIECIREFSPDGSFLRVRGKGSGFVVSLGPKAREQYAEFFKALYDREQKEYNGWTLDRSVLNRVLDYLGE